MRSPLPSHDELEEQIKLLGRYAILSHRWDEGQELSFTDNLLDPSSKRPASTSCAISPWSRKLNMGAGTSGWTLYASPKRTARRRYRACVCVVYLTAPHSIREDPWFTRGWTLQEFLAARQIKVFLSRFPINCRLSRR